jgi:hypothetical protein
MALWAVQAIVPSDQMAADDLCSRRRPDTIVSGRRHEEGFIDCT